MSADNAQHRQEIERSAQAALETYSNVHRGSGHHSLVSTRLYEQARDLVLEHLGLSRKGHAVIFCTPRRAAALAARLPDGRWRCLASRDLGLPLGVCAVAVERRALPGGAPLETGGGTARLVGADSVIWARVPDRFEAGTPAIINAIAFARALQRSDRASGDASDGEVPESDDLRDRAGRELLGCLRQTLIGGGARVPTRAGDSPFVNFDNAASTPTFRPVWNAVRRSWRMSVGERPALIERARSVCAETLGAPRGAYDVIFTGNTTEAVNLVAQSLGQEARTNGGAVVLNTLLEHNSNELPWRSTPGLSQVRLPVDREGFLDPAELERVLGGPAGNRIRLVAVCGASNVLGVFNDIPEISRIVHRHGARLLVDAAQWVAHRRVEVEALGIDYLVFSGHKVYAPFGAGALLARKGSLAFAPSEIEAIRSSSEENVGGIAGLSEALALLHRIGFDAIQEEEQALTRRALSGMAKLSRVKVYGIADPASPRFARKGGVIAFDVKGVLPGRVARALAERGGIGVRYGCHCAHLLIRHLVGVPRWAESVQHLMVSLLPGFNLPGVVRVSFGIQNTEAEVDRFLEVLGDVARRPRAHGIGPRMDEYVGAAVRRVYGE